MTGMNGTAGTRALPLIVVAALTAAALCAPARGAGEETRTPTCKKGEVYSQKAKKCVKKTSANLSDDEVADYAYALAKAERYGEALDTLGMLKNPETAKALNYRGYATRKLGRTEEGVGYYLRAVKLDPDYALVREYLGEAYVIQGKADLAREQLGAIEAICGRGCEEYRDLSEALEQLSPG